MYVGYLRFGENLVINNELTRAYARFRNCPVAWFQKPYCDTLNEALGEPWAYDDYPLEDIPWYDAKLQDESSRFFGVWGIEYSLVQDSTRFVPVVEGITDGGVIGRTRKGVKRLRVRALLVAEGRDALDYGMAWLNAVIDPDACGQVSAKCGTADLEWLADCPPARDSFTPPLNEAEYEVEVDSYRRFLRTSAAESGAYVTAEHRRGDFFAYEVEFDFVSETPHILGVPTTIPLEPAAPSVVQDVVYNLIYTPSAERAAGTVLLQTNYSTNPSAETNDTGWFASQSGSGVGAATKTRVNTVAAVGVWSIRSTSTMSASGSNGRIAAYQDVTLPAYAAGQEFSFSMWGFQSVTSGTAALGGLDFEIEWRDGAGVVGAAIPVDSLPAGQSGALSGNGFARPAGSTIVRCIMWGDVATFSSGAVVNTYADALVASLP